MRGNAFTVNNLPNGVYKLIAKKRNHTTATVSGIVINGGNISLSTALKLLGGDLTGDNIINAYDASVLYSEYYSVGADYDLNDDNAVNGYDASILYGNYYSVGQEIAF
jgi:hypothetical protein